MTREITYEWKVREFMARSHIYNSKELTELLRQRGITLSPTQVWRLVTKDPERISFAVLGALCDILGVQVNELIVFTASDARTMRRKTAGGTELPGLRDYRPVRARIVTDDVDE
jgi:DNA-binding Xre family transcriptional regulator